jgi:hypothetical protein
MPSVGLPAGGVRGAAVEADPVLRLGGQRRPPPAVDPGVEHQRGVDVVEHARLGLGDLASAALLRGRAHDQHGPLAPPQHGPCSERGSQSGGGDQIVAAGVPEAGQGVVLQQEGDGRPVDASGPGGERGGQAGQLPLDGEALAFEFAAQQPGRPVLLEGVLRICVQGAGDLPQPFRPDGHFPGHPPERLAHLVHRVRRVCHTGLPSGPLRTCRRCAGSNRTASHTTGGRRVRALPTRSGELARRGPGHSTPVADPDESRRFWLEV